MSTRSQVEEGLSLEAQERQAREYIERQGWQLAEIYVEAGVSGRRDDRPELTRLLANLDAIDALVIPRLDRLGRSNRHLHNIFGRLEAAGVELVSLADNIDTSTAAGGLMRALLTALAEFESATTGERVKAVAGGRVEAGFHHGKAPYAYRSEGGHLVVNEIEGAVVREIFESAAAGASQREIARRLNRRGIKSQRGGQWGQASIAKLLKNPTYVGRVEIHGETFRGEHTAIIEPELWDRVAQLRKANRTRGGAHGRPTIGRHLFTHGLLRCGWCGSAMVCRAARRKGGGLYETYMCDGLDCDMGSIPRVALDGPTWAYFSEVAVDVDAMRQQLREQTDRKLKESKDRQKAAQRSLTATQAARERLTKEYIGKEIDAERWALMLASLETEEQHARVSLEREELIQTEAADADVTGEAARRLAELKAAIAGEVTDAAGLDAVRASLGRLFDSFEVFRIGPEGDPADLPPEIRAIAEAQAREIEETETEAIEAGGWSILPYPTVATIEELGMPVRLLLRTKNESVRLA